MELNEELESLNLFSPQSARPSTMFFGLNNKNHGSSQDLLKYPALCKLCQLVNGHKDVHTELDCCNVVCLSNNKQSIRLHADNEASIDQSHPIATVSLGAMHKVEFAPFGSSYDHTVVIIQAEHNSMYVMRPETQSTLQHRVVRGTSSNLKIKFVILSPSVSLNLRHGADSRFIPARNYMLIWIGSVL